ncbi:MAG: TIGR03557 family F420-dependent LLM class oxidoreductase [Actinomycetota bacterium]
MIEIGYALSSEEQGPNNLVRWATLAEQAGFSFASISDHYHPWIDKQGHSAFVWGVIGAISQVTERLGLGTGVTCPLIRTHPAIIAQAAATSQALMGGRFYLGLGTGENLNEHILGGNWPSSDLRLNMLKEAIEVIRKLWEGDEVTHRGKYFTVDHARVYCVPQKRPPIMVAAAGPKATEMAAKLGDGLIATSPDGEQVEAFDRAGGKDKPKYGMVHVCWAPDEQSGVKTALEYWPNTALKGELGQELPLPRHFEQAAGMVTEEDISSKMVCGPDPGRHIDEIRQYEKAGFTHVYVHQVGPDQEGFFNFYRDKVLPAL